MAASCSANERGKSQRKNLGSAGRRELAIGRSVSGGSGSGRGGLTAGIEDPVAPEESLATVARAFDVLAVAAGRRHDSRRDGGATGPALHLPGWLRRG